MTQTQTQTEVGMGLAREERDGKGDKQRVIGGVEISFVYRRPIKQRVQFPR
jgi:hypothetical protein